MVADVCREANPDDPQSASQPRFDASRANAGHPQAPTAKRICVRLRLSWVELKQFALDPARNVDITVGRRTGRDEEKWITPEFCIATTRTVASKISEDEPLTPVRYTIEIELMLAADHRRHVHGRRLTMPSVRQIEWRLGRWPQALRRAGLKPPDQAVMTAGIAGIDAIELCLETTGCLVSSGTLVKWISINERPLTNWRGTSYPEEVAKLRVRRAAEGKWTPTSYTSPGTRPDRAASAAERSHVI